jgi:hypothetical protein
MEQSHYQYISDAQGQRTHVVLPIAEFDELLDALLDAQVIQRLPALREELETAERITIEELRKEFGLDP